VIQFIDDYYGWWFDQSVKMFLIGWYTPNFIIGNADEWIKLGVTLNGIRHIRC